MKALDALDQRRGEARHRLLPLLVWGHPAGVALGLSQCLAQVVLQALELDRPGSDQSLEDVVALDSSAFRASAGRSDSSIQRSVASRHSWAIPASDAETGAQIA